MISSLHRRSVSVTRAMATSCLHCPAIAVITNAKVVPRLGRLLLVREVLIAEAVTLPPGAGRAYASDTQRRRRLRSGLAAVLEPRRCPWQTDNACGSDSRW